MDGRNVKLCLDALQARRIDRGANVDGGREQADLESDEKLLGGRPIPRVMGVIGRPGNEEVVGTFLLVGQRLFLI